MSKKDAQSKENKKKKMFSLRNAHMPVRLVFFAIILYQAVATFLSEPVNSDLIFFVVIATAWFTASIFIRRGVRKHNWTEGLARIITSSMDAYCIMVCLALSSGASSTAIRVFGLYCFVLVFVTDPISALAAAGTGVLAYISVYTLPHQNGITPVWVAATAGIAGVICGMAWRTVAPILLRSVKLLIKVYQTSTSDVTSKGLLDGLIHGELDTPEIDEDAARIAEEKEKSDEEPSEDDFDTESLKMELSEKDNEIAALKEQKDALSRELEKTIGEGFGPKTGKNEKEPDADTSEETEAAPPENPPDSETVQKLQEENVKLKEQIESLQKDIDEATTALFQKTVASPASKNETEQDSPETGKNVAELDALLKKTEDERDSLKKELEQTNEELMKVFENVEPTQESQKDDSELQTLLKKTEEERDALKKELEQTNEELMKLFENAESS